MSQKSASEIRQHSFAKLGGTMDMPDLLAVQKDSFAHLLQADVVPEKRENDGLQAVFQDVFPITDVKENYSLEFVKYSIGEPKYTVEECQERDMTFARARVFRSIDGEQH